MYKVCTVPVLNCLGVVGKHSPVLDGTLQYRYRSAGSLAHVQAIIDKQ